MMTETTTSSSGSSAVESTRLDGVTEPPPEPAELDKAQREAIAQMVRQAKDAGIALTGPDGLLKALTAQIVEAALYEELNEHLGYDKHDPAGRNGANSRNGTGPRRWSQTIAARWRLPFLGIVTAVSSRSSWPSGSVG